MKCCFCGKEIDGFGNNPSPFAEIEELRDARCCDECNSGIVIPARLTLLQLQKDLEGFDEVITTVNELAKEVLADEDNI